MTMGKLILAVVMVVALVSARASASAPTGAVTLRGLVMLKYTNRSGMFENFRLQVGTRGYTVVTNFYDGRRPLTHVVNLRGREVPVQFIQVANFVTVTGVLRRAKLFGLPVLRASTVLVPT